MTLKIIGTTAAILLPIFLASSIKPFSGDLTCVDEYSEEIYAVARVVWKEARSEPDEGKRMVVQVIRNRAEHYKESVLKTTRRGMAWDGRIEPEIIEIVKEEMKKEICHSFKHWINFELATDARQIRVARKAINNGKAIRLGAHWFY